MNEVLVPIQRSEMRKVKLEQGDGCIIFVLSNILLYIIAQTHGSCHIPGT